ncbi:MAG: prefoldin subunit [archaeon]
MVVTQKELQQDIQAFEQYRNQLMGVSNQKQQTQMQANALSAAVEALKETKEKKVFKAVGNVLIQSDTKIVLEDTIKQKESLELRVKSLQKQEDIVVNNLNKIKAKIESTQKTEEDKNDKKVN